MRADRTFARSLTDWIAAFGLVLAALLANAATADAEFSVCNKTRILVNVAMGVEAGDDFETEGWWTVTPGACATLIRGPLKSRYVYLYAINIQAEDVISGAVTMCVDRLKFKARGIADCWRRGLQPAAFAEIDTQDAADWTTFLTESGK